MWLVAFPRFVKSIQKYGLLDLSDIDKKIQKKEISVIYFIYLISSTCDCTNLVIGKQILSDNAALPRLVKL